MNMSTFVKCETAPPSSLRGLFSETKYAYDISPLLVKSLNWPTIFTMIHSSLNLNDECEKFVKSYLLSETIEKFSNGLIKYVNEQGCDFLITSTQTRIEMKSSSVKIFPKPTLKRPTPITTSQVTLKNYNGNITGISKTFDYLMLIDNDQAGIIPYEELMPHFIHKDSCVCVKSPLDKIEILQIVTKKSSGINLTKMMEQFKSQVFGELHTIYGG